MTAGSSNGEEGAPAGGRRDWSARQIGDVRLTADTTAAQVEAVWGRPVATGPGGIIAGYALPGGDRLWLSFEPEAPRRLARALYLRGDVTPKVEVLFDGLCLAERRRLDQLDFSRPLTVADVNAIWGPPDGVMGSGIEYYLYGLADGTTRRIVFDGDRVLGSGGSERTR